MTALKPATLAALLAATACSTGSLPTSLGGNAPAENPRPRQVVRLHGRIPASLKVELEAVYEIGDREGDCEPLLIGGAIAPVIDQYRRTVPLAMKRDGERYEATLVVDKYLPGPCGWRFDYVDSAVVKTAYPKHVETFEPAIVERWEPPTGTICPWDDADSCPAVSNSDPTPAYVRCILFDGGSERSPSLICSPSSSRSVPHKQVHLLTAQTRTVEVNFFDLSLEQDPVPLKP